MTCFERLVISHIRSCLPTNLDPLHFAYSANRSTEDGISTLLHLTLTHMENKNTCARILLMDFSSAFNTILPQQLVERLLLQGLQDSGVCRWIINFKKKIVSTGTPQGCVLSPLLFNLLTYECAPADITFADNTTVVCLFTNNDESTYMKEV